MVCRSPWKGIVYYFWIYDVYRLTGGLVCDTLMEISAKALVEIAELAASYVSNKASMWTHFQMKEPSILSKMSGK